MFLNCTAHKLTEEQINTIRELYTEVIVELKDDNSILHSKLVNCPSEIGELQELARNLLEYLKVKYSESKGKLVIHFPIGSPAFNALFFRHQERENLPLCFVFSHTERKSVDEKQEDGSVIKRSIFQFVKFIEI
ncbi:MAG: hypothetical protein H7A25_01665 [Leptospiraceae bacterium]|nr:hypothetical protein [Leptospiraceae bacterium]MCP5498584.1 hypothetical protein [Leptospiraceae bacterium]